MTDKALSGYWRHARMRIRSVALISRGADSWASEIVDLSATGALLERPAGWTGSVGDLFALDMLIGEDLHIHLEATVARLTGKKIGFAYARIPESGEIPLWELLGGYADRLEPYDD